MKYYVPVVQLHCGLFIILKMLQFSHISTVTYTITALKVLPPKSDQHSTR